MAVSCGQAKDRRGGQILYVKRRFVAALRKRGNVHPACRFDAEMSYLGIENKGHPGHMKRPS